MRFFGESGPLKGVWFQERWTSRRIEWQEELMGSSLVRILILRPWRESKGVFICCSLLCGKECGVIGRVSVIPNC